MDILLLLIFCRRLYFNIQYIRFLQVKHIMVGWEERYSMLRVIIFRDFCKDFFC